MILSVTVPAVYVGTYHQYNGGSIFGEWFDLTDFDDEDEFYDAFDDAYCGEAESEEDFAYGFVEDHGLLNEVPESLRVYFDYEAWARDLFSSGYVFHEGYVFSN